MLTFSFILCKNIIYFFNFFLCYRCDRIIWYGEGLKQQLYDRGESKLSDHRPVKAIFSTQIKVSRKLKRLQSLFLSERFEKITSHLEIQSPKDDDFPYV